MTKKQFVNSKGETWEYDETPEVVAALKQLRISSVNTKLNKPQPYKNEITNS